MTATKPPMRKPQPGTTDPRVLPEDERPKVQLPGNDRLLSDFAAELARKLKDKGLYQRGGITVVVNPLSDKLEPVMPQTLRTLVEQHLICYRVHVSTKGNTFNFDQTMTSEDAKGVLAAKQFIEALPRLDRFATVRLPVMRNDGTVELLEHGYDAAAATLTKVKCAYDLDLPLGEARKIIDDLLAEFSFAKDDVERSRAVSVAAMVGQFANGLIPQGTPRPVIANLANDAGAGKTLIAKCALLPIHGAVDLSGGLKDGPEMNKVLLTAIIEGRDYILFDNCKGYLNSPALEAFVSAAHWSDRILGLSKSFSGENNVNVFLTGNGCTFSPDLRRRSLIVQLFMPEEFAEERNFKRTLDDTALLALRPKILAALWAFVREWCAAGRPKPSRQHSSFPRWAEVVSGVVEFVGYGSPLERAKIEGMVDTDSSDMRELVEALSVQPGRGYEFEELSAKCRELGLFERIVNDVDNLGTMKPGPKSTFGHILKRYDRRCFGHEKPLYFLIDGKGHKRRFSVGTKAISGTDA
jgi:hypothetical protein